MDKQKVLTEEFKKYLIGKDVDLCDRVIPITAVEVSKGKWGVASLATKGVHLQ